MDEDDNDHEKTQIWLPGGDLPKPKKTGAAAHEVLLKPARKPAADSSEVDFDITTGTAAAPSTTAAPPRKAATGKSAPPPPKQSALGWIAVVVAVLVVLIAGFLLTR